VAYCVNLYVVLHFVLFDQVLEAVGRKQEPPGAFIKLDGFALGFSSAKTLHVFNVSHVILYSSLYEGNEAPKTGVFKSKVFLFSH